MALNIDSAYPTITDMAKRLAQQRRQRTATTGREETYDEGVAITEGAIRAGLAARDRNIPFKLEKERMLEQKRQFDVSSATQTEQYQETFDENKRRFDIQQQNADEAAEMAGITSLATTGISAAAMLAPKGGWLAYLGFGGGTAAAGTAAAGTVGAAGAGATAFATTAGTTAIAAGGSTSAGLMAAMGAAATPLAAVVGIGIVMYGLYSLFNSGGGAPKDYYQNLTAEQLAEIEKQKRKAAEDAALHAGKPGDAGEGYL